MEEETCELSGIIRRWISCTLRSLRENGLLYFIEVIEEKNKEKGGAHQYFIQIRHLFHVNKENGGTHDFFINKRNPISRLRILVCGLSYLLLYSNCILYLSSIPDSMTKILKVWMRIKGIQMRAFGAIRINAMPCVGGRGRDVPHALKIRPG